MSATSAPGHSPVRLDDPFQLDDYVSAVQWSPGGDRLAAVSLAGDGVVLGDGGPEALDRHEQGALSLAWSSDGSHLATGGQDGILRLRRDDTVVAEHDLGGWINTLDWSPGGRPLLAAGAGRSMVVVDLDRVVLADGTSPATVTAAVWSADGRRVGFGSYGGITWFEPPSLEPCRRFDWQGSILTLTPAPNGKWVASGNQDNSVHVWRLWTGEDLEMTGYAAKIQCLAWDPTSRWLCVGDVGEITCWDFKGRGPRGSRPRTLSGHTRRITALEFSGAILASASADGTVRLWRPPSSRPVAVIDIDREISALAWHPGGRALAVGTADGEVGVVAAPS